MDKLKLHIVHCPTNHYKLSGEGIAEHYEEALKEGNQLYLDLYSKVYKGLMFKDFNTLWTPDTFSKNDIDPKDGFWAMGYFFFTVALLRILSKKSKLEIVDKTPSEFRNQKHLFRFLKEEGIKYSVNKEKRQQTSFKSSVRKFVMGSIRDIIKSKDKSIDFLKKEFLDGDDETIQRFGNDKNDAYIYLTIPPIGNMSVKEYLQWRYYALFKHLKPHEKKGNRVLLIGTKEFKDSDEFEYPFINAFKLLPKKKRLVAFLKAVFAKVRTSLYVFTQYLKPGISSVDKYFLKHVPRKLYYAVKENEAFDNLFETHGKGLLIMKGPIVYKGACIHNHNARKHGVRVLSISGRILTSTRLTNCFLDVHHKEDGFPTVMPHSMMVSDRISSESIQKQCEEIDIYPHETPRQKVTDHESVHNPFTITLALQKKNEMESMIEAVISAVQNMENVVVNFKMHPDFPIPLKQKEKYGKMPFVNILSIDTPLNEAVEMSDLCVTAYSTSAFEFAKKMKPIVWINYVTLNSLFFTDVHKKVGLVAGSNGELEQILRRMKEDRRFYDEQKKIHYTQLKNLVFETNNEVENSFNKIIDKELEKV